MFLIQYVNQESLYWTEVTSRTHEWRQVSLCSAWRCDKVMDIYSGCALCLPNLTYPVLYQPTHTPPLCIEIKVLGLAALSRFCNRGSRVLKRWFFWGSSLEDVRLVRVGRRTGCNLTRLCDCDCNSVSVCLCVSVCIVFCGFSPSVAFCRPPNTWAKTSRPKFVASACTNFTR